VTCWASFDVKNLDIQKKIKRLSKSLQHSTGPVDLRFEAAGGAAQVQQMLEDEQLEESQVAALQARARTQGWRWRELDARQVERQEALALGT
jgi:hypothetical protein